jgi:hypothetical protein
MFYRNFSTYLNPATPPRHTYGILMCDSKPVYQCAFSSRTALFMVVRGLTRGVSGASGRLNT